MNVEKRLGISAKIAAGAMTLPILLSGIDAAHANQESVPTPLAHSQLDSKENVLNNRGIIFEVKSDGFKGKIFLENHTKDSIKADPPPSPILVEAKPVTQNVPEIIQAETSAQKARRLVNGLLLSEAQKEVAAGYRERSNHYTKYGDWYEKHVVNPRDNPKDNFTNAAWCDMFLAWIARKAGAQKLAGEFAYTPHHAEWFKKHGGWRSTPTPGAFVFFDWGGGKQISGIDHVGIVEKVDKNGNIHTIEGNTDDRLLRKVRNQSTVVGYGDPSKVMS